MTLNQWGPWGSSQNFSFGEEVTVPLPGYWARSMCVCVYRGVVTRCERHLTLVGRGLEEDH